MDLLLFALFSYAGLSFAAHSLLGNEEDEGCQDHASADRVEDRGTDATGAGKFGAGIVLNGLIKGDKGTVLLKGDKGTVLLS